MFDPNLVTCIPIMSLIANRLDHLPELSSWCTQECLESSYLASQLFLVNVVSRRDFKFQAQSKVSKSMFFNEFLFAAKVTIIRGKCRKGGTVQL
jgi:hypothetical protein